MGKIYRFTFGGRCYHSKKAAGDAIKAVLNAQPMAKTFDSEPLADLIAKYHYYCSKHGMRPIKFRKAYRRRGGYRLEGYFIEVGWHGVSYLKCLTPPTFESSFNKALRAAVEPVVWAGAKAFCEKCGSQDRLEQDHVEPKFNDVLKACLEAANDVDRAAWENFDWARQEEFVLPRNGAAVPLALKMHEGAVIRTLCAPCHRNVKRRPNAKAKAKAGLGGQVRDAAQARRDQGRSEVRSGRGHGSDQELRRPTLEDYRLPMPDVRERVHPQREQSARELGRAAPRELPTGQLILPGMT